MLSEEYPECDGTVGARTRVSADKSTVGAVAFGVEKDYFSAISYYSGLFHVRVDAGSCRAKVHLASIGAL